jgi:hypothetical protein
MKEEVAREDGGPMYALRIREQGTSEGLTYEEAPVPEPGTGDVLVRVHAASFTPTELACTSGSDKQIALVLMIDQGERLAHPSTKSTPTRCVCFGIRDSTLGNA